MDLVYGAKLISVAAILVNLSLMEASNFVDRPETITGQFLTSRPRLRQLIASFASSGRKFRLFQRGINFCLAILSFFPINVGFILLNIAMLGSSLVRGAQIERSVLAPVRIFYSSLTTYITLLCLPLLLCLFFEMSSKVISLAWWSQVLSLYGSYSILTAFFGLMAGYCGKATTFYALGYIQGCILMTIGAYLGGPPLYPFAVMEACLALIFLFFFYERLRLRPNTRP